MTTPIFPSALPHPSSWGLRAGLGKLSSAEQEESAPLVQRAPSRVPRGTVSVSWQLAGPELAVFTAFGRDTLLGYHRWFWLQCPVGRTMSYQLVRFTRQPDVTGVGYRYATVRGELELRDTQLVKTFGNFVETFDSLDPYSTLSGNGALFTLEEDADTGSSVLNCAAQNTTVIARIIRNLPEPIDVNELSLDFKVTASNADDSASIGIASAFGSPGFTFIPRLEAFYSPARLPYLYLSNHGLSEIPVADTAVPLNVWYTLRMWYVDGAGMYLEIRRKSDNALHSPTELFAGVSGSILPNAGVITATADRNGLTCPARFDNIELRETVAS